MSASAGAAAGKHFEANPLVDERTAEDWPRIQQSVIAYAAAHGISSQ
jgi:hypothetical protein